MILLDILTAVFTAYSFTWRTPQFVIPKAASLDFFATDIAIDARIFKFNAKIIYVLLINSLHTRCYGAVLMLIFPSLSIIIYLGWWFTVLVIGAGGWYEARAEIHPSMFRGAGGGCCADKPTSRAAPSGGRSLLSPSTSSSTSDLAISAMIISLDTSLTFCRLF